MTEETIFTTFTKNWFKFVPLISSEIQDPPTEGDQLNAIIKMDKCFRSGPSHKLPAAFKVYKVLYIIQQ